MFSISSEMCDFVEKYRARNIPIMKSSVKNISLAIVQQISASSIFSGWVGDFAVGWWGVVADWSEDGLGVVGKWVFLMFSEIWFGNLWFLEVSS